MNRLVFVASAAFGLVCAGSVSATQYETYATDLGFGYELVAFVGHTPAAFAQAQRAASQWEGRRHIGLGPQTIAAVAVDDTAGVAQQVRWVRPDNTVAVVNIH